MILLVHMLLGAAIGSTALSAPLAVILAFLSHYFLDLLPHIEYPIENLQKKQWQKALPDIFRVTLDFCLGAFIIVMLSKNQLIIYACAFMAILPDGITVISRLMPSKILALHDKLHEKIHFLKQTKISNFWRFSSQILVIIVSIILIKS